MAPVKKGIGSIIIARNMSAGRKKHSHENKKKPNRTKNIVHKSGRNRSRRYGEKRVHFAKEILPKSSSKPKSITNEKPQNTVKAAEQQERWDKIVLHYLGRLRGLCPGSSAPSKKHGEKTSKPHQELKYTPSMQVLKDSIVAGYKSGTKQAAKIVCSALKYGVENGLVTSESNNLFRIKSTSGIRMFRSRSIDRDITKSLAILEGRKRVGTKRRRRSNKRQKSKPKRYAPATETDSDNKMEYTRKMSEKYLKERRSEEMESEENAETSDAESRVSKDGKSCRHGTPSKNTESALKSKHQKKGKSDGPEAKKRKPEQQEEDRETESVKRGGILHKAGKENKLMMSHRRSEPVSLASASNASMASELSESASEDDSEVRESLVEKSSERDHERGHRASRSHAGSERDNDSDNNHSEEEDGMEDDDHHHHHHHHEDGENAQRSIKRERSNSCSS